MTIITGEMVVVRFSRNDAYSFQDGRLELSCKLLHMPNDTGDHFYFQYGDIEFSVNPQSPDFVGIYRKGGN